MSIRIQMIGTGSQFAKNYFNNNALLMTDIHTLMIDCGMTGPLALHRSGRTFADIDGIFLTHLHADHIGGLEEAAFVSKYVHHRKPLLFVPEKLIFPLWEHSLKAGLEQPDSHGLDSYFQVVPLTEGPAVQVFPGLFLEIVQTRHMDHMMSYSLIVNDFLFYSGDMQFDRELMNDLIHIRKCRHILHDCQLTEQSEVHASLAQLLTLPASVQRKISLMHYGDDMASYKGRTGEMRFLEQATEYTFN